MKTQFIKALTKTMVGACNFLIIKDRNGNLAIGEEHTILAKDHLGSNIVVELIDGDRLSVGEITARLQNNKRLITTNKPKHGFFFFEVFIFEETPDQDRLTAISAGQFQNLFGKTFLKCLTVNLGEKCVERLFNVPKSDLGLSKTITRLFTTGFDTVSDSDIEELVFQKEAEYKIPLQSQVPVITYTLIGLNILVGFLIFLYSKRTGLSYAELLFTFGAKENFKILSGEYWRFLTPVFLHANILHLFINCYSLFAIGVLVEKIFGRSRFTFVYFAAGTTGNIASFIFSTNPGVGASGAIFGLLGALLYFGINKPTLFKSHFGNNVILTILINLGYGFSVKGIDNFAHIGGLIGGFLASGMAALPSPKKSWYTNRVFYLAVTIIMVVSGLFYGFNNTQSKIIIQLNELTKLDQAKNWTQVELKAKQILELNPNDKNIKSYLLWTLVKAQSFSGDYVEAISNAQKLAAIDPQNGHYLLGLLYYDTRQYALARQELEQAKKAGAKQEIIDQLIKEIDRLEK